jgi:hypothetical protein
MATPAEARPRCATIAAEWDMDADARRALVVFVVDSVYTNGCCALSIAGTSAISPTPAKKYFHILMPLIEAKTAGVAKHPARTA